MNSWERFFSPLQKSILLKDVYYKGTESEWNKISIDSNNEPLTNATIHFEPLDEAAPKIIISSCKTKPGKEIELTIDLSANTGFASLGVEVGYDADIMTLIKATPNANVGATFTPAQHYPVNPFNMSWDNASDVTYNGNLVTLTLRRM